MYNMTITSAQYEENLEGNKCSIQAIIDGQEWFVPLDETNRHYFEIMRQVDAGELTIAEAD